MCVLVPVMSVSSLFFGLPKCDLGNLLVYNSSAHSSVPAKAAAALITHKNVVHGLAQTKSQTRFRRCWL